MNCECNNKSNRVKPGIKHVYGNVLRMAIPLTLRTLVKDGDVMNVTDTDFIPSSDHPVRVVFSKGKRNYPIIATMDGNVAIVEDKGKIPVGTYDISVECYDDLGNPYRFKQNAVLYVADTTAEAGIDEEIEYEAQTWYLNAAVFLATTQIGEIGDAIDAKLDDVFGNVAYDSNAKEIRFYNKDNSRVLATIDSRPFIADGTVADVYIDVSRQVLVVVLNEDAGGTRFSVPMYLIFNSYYKKDEVDSLVSRTVEGLRFDFSQELPLVVSVTKNGSSISSAVDFGVIDNAIHEDGRIVVACVNNAIFYQLLSANSIEIAFSRVVALDGYQELLVVDKSNVWIMEDVDLGTGGGGGGYEPPAGGIPKTDLASGVQASLNKADTALQQSDLSGYATTDDVDDAVAALVSSAPQTLDTLKELADALGDDPNFAATMATQLGNKVDKETGKSLMTDAERTKLQGIAAGAEVNVQADWNQTTTTADDYIKNKPTLATVATSGSYNDLQDKPTIPTVPTNVSAFTNDAGYTTNTGTVTGISVNGGTAQQPTNGVVNLTVAPAADMVRVDNDNFEGETLDEVLDDVYSKSEVDTKVAEAGSGAVSVTTNQDGTFTIHVGDDDYTVNLNHTHENMAKLIVCEESDLPSTLDPATIYAQVNDADNPTEIEVLYIAGLEFAGGGVPAGTPAITKPSGTTINLGENSGSGVSKSIEIRANSHITGDLTVGLAANSDLSFDTTNLPSGVTYNSGAGTLTIAQATAMQGVNITIVYSGSGAAEIDGGLIITGGGTSPKSVTVVVTVGALDLEAIKLTGSQWLETNYYPNSLTEFELEVKFTANTNTEVANASNMRVFIGCRPNGSSPQEFFTLYNASTSSNRAYGMEMLNKADVAGQAITDSMSSLLTVDHSVIKYTNGLLTFDPGGTGVNIKSVSLQTKTASMIYPLNLGINRQASKDVIYGKFDLTIYRLTIKENGVNVRNYVPKTVGGVPGLYDTVNEVFISSKTSDEVVAIPLT